MSNRYHFSYRFNSVGQGLFASGCLCNCYSGGRSSFRWVYDCGTSSGDSLVNAAISRLHRSICRHCHRCHYPLSPPSVIDLVVISHFDKDHISGICELVKKYQVKILMLPYMAQELRLQLAFEEDIGPNDDMMGFFVNPVEYLSTLDGANIKSFLYVQGTGGEGPTSSEQPEPPPETPNNDQDKELLHIEYDESFKLDAPSMSGADVSALKPGGTIRLRGFWEFVPYNDDDITIEVPDDFRYAVRKASDKLLKPSSPDERKNALRDLRDLYDECFGITKRNIISLFLFAGPIYSAWDRLYPFHVCSRNNSSRDYVHSKDFHPFNNKGRGSILYTGDGYLNTKKRLTKLSNFLGQNRMRRLSVLQVMHHGSKNNWYPGIAKELNPLLSIFSSDPLGQFWHPDAEVLRDFWSFGPSQVDKHNDAEICFGGAVK